MNQLVKIVKNNIFTDSLVIAQGTGNQHHAVRELIKNIKQILKILELYSFQMRKVQGEDLWSCFD